MKDGTIEQLASLAEKLQRYQQSYSVIFHMPSSSPWLVKPGQPPLEIQSEQVQESDVTISILSEEAIGRFSEGDFIPQEEVLSGSWQVQGQSEAIMLVTQMLFDEANSYDS